MDQADAFDLTLNVADDGPVHLSLPRDGAAILTADLEGGDLYRPRLSLQPGLYRLEISGDRTAPVDYVAGQHPALQDAEGEPDDQPELARPLEAGQALRGLLAEGNPGHVRFTVTALGHLWELRGVQGLSVLSLTDGNGASIGQWEATSGAMALRLALPPGTYTAKLRGDGPYALRLTDLGSVPQGLKTEPNNDQDSTLRLRPAIEVAGDFQAQATQTTTRST